MRFFSVPGASRATAVILTVCILAQIALAGVASADYTPSYDFEMQRAIYDVKVVPEEWKLLLRAEFTAVPAVKNAQKVLLMLPPGRTHNKFHVREVTPSGTIREIETSGPWRVWELALDQPQTSGDEFTIVIEGEIVTDANAYPSDRLMAGVTPEGVYGISVDFWFWPKDGQRTYRPDPEYRIEVPEGWTIAEPAVEDPYQFQLFAGPYQETQVEVAGTVLDVLYYDPEYLEMIPLWMSQTYETMEPLLGEPISREWTVVELPKYHGGGINIPGLIAFATEMSPHLITAPSSLDELVYHETAHSWMVLRAIKGWPSALESLTEYKVYLILKDHHDSERAMNFLLDKRQRYLEIVSDSEELLISEAVGTAMTPEVRAVRYYKFTWFWHELRYLMGDDNFFALLREVYTSWPARNYQPIEIRDFKRTVNRFTTLDLDQFIDDWLEKTGLAQFAVDNLKSEPAGTAGQEGRAFTTTFTLNSLGSHHPPKIEVLLQGDGESEVTEIALEPSENELSLETTFEVDAVVVDPNNWFLKTELGPSISIMDIVLYSSLGLAALTALGAIFLRARNAQRAKAGGPPVG